MSAARQPLLFDVPPSQPEGFAYRPEFLSPDEETRLAAWLATLAFEPFQFRGYEGKRRVVSFGWRYDFTRSHLEQANDMPAELLPVRVRAAAFADLAPEDLQQCLLNEYLPGAPIGWHRDRPAFGQVMGVSLLTPAPLRLRLKRPDGGWTRVTQRLEPRSAYRLAGPARSRWEHSIPPLDALRYSITFRTLADG